VADSDGKKTWTVVFRCQSCRGRFIIRRATVERINLLQSAYTCPNCGTRPYEGRPHVLAELITDNFPTYRKTPDGDTWHFDPSCNHWPDDHYVELDGAPHVGELCVECVSRRRLGN
jgi:predicted RNA-binding Zn-ribbon protein involved in translation (DUF1610 family)